MISLSKLYEPGRPVIAGRTWKELPPNRTFPDCRAFSYEVLIGDKLHRGERDRTIKGVIIVSKDIIESAIVGGYEAITLSIESHAWQQAERLYPEIHEMITWSW